MPALADLDVPSFDYTDASITGPRFHDVMEGLRERSWIARAEPAGWLVLDHQAVAFFMRTPAATFPGRKMLELQGVTSGPLYERLKGNLLDLHGDDHRRLRKLVQPAFTPKEADRLRPLMREQLDALWRAVAADGACDFVEAFAKPYPARMIAAVMGAPLEDAPRLHEWANLIQGQFDPIKVANELPALERAAAEFVAYTEELLAKRKDDPSDDLISKLIAARGGKGSDPCHGQLATDQDQGSDPLPPDPLPPDPLGDRLAEDELVHLVSAVLVGGVDTTQSQLAHGVRLLAENPEQWRLLGDDPELVAAAVEEVLRYEPITPLTARITLEELEYRDVEFPAGTIVLASALTANHDPAQYEAPDALDVRADRGRAKALTFGAGPHFCLGANLARAELQEAFAFLAPRMRELALAGEPVYDTPLGVYGLRELPVSFTASG